MFTELIVLYYKCLLVETYGTVINAEEFRPNTTTVESC